MKKKLLATVAVAAVVGLGGVAVAQSQMGDSNKSPSATQEKSGGSMSGTQSGSKTLNPSSTQSSKPSSGQSAQGMDKSGKDNERLGQGANQEQKGMTRGAQEEKRGMQKGAQEERGLQKNQKGAQEERGTNLKGAQEQRGTNVKGAQEQRGTTERGTAETTKSGVNSSTSVGSSGTRGSSVQLSENQRSQIKTIIGRERGPRLGSNVNFDVSVGTRIPRSVHIVVLPEEIVLLIPEYRGYDYFLIGDEIVIVDPRTLEIVAIIPA
ncbi:MAG TPA: DUF1236 domain-containing protein [Xanthobacteraceae bacterium]|nr:DUF1236 domain-containing protein [Xanthobacteraceae bacterium]